jgi:beta-lactamase class A
VRLPPLPAAARWSVLIVDAADGTVRAEHRPDDVLRTASLGKLFLLSELARALVAGELDPDGPLTRSADDIVADSGLWQHLRVPTLSVDDLAVLVGAVSDNLATNVLLRRVGLAAVHRRTAGLGITDAALHDRVRDHRSPEDPPTLSTGSARAYTRFFTGLCADGDPAAAHVRRWLSASVDQSMVAAAFGLDPLAHQEPDRGLLLHHKTGTNRDVRADTGLLTGPRGRLAYAVIANWEITEPDHDPVRDDVLAAMRAVGALLRQEVSGRPG